MKRSTERILTTHVGSLARSDSLIPLLRLRENRQPYDREELATLVRDRFHGTYPPNFNEGTHLISRKGPTRFQVVPLVF